MALIFQRLRQYALLVRLHKPIGTLLLLWPTLWALWLAGAGHPDAKVFAVFVSGVFLMRSAGCAINDFADRDIDPHVARTRDRPVAVGAIGAVEALLVFVVLALIAFALVLTQNQLTIKLALAAAVLATAYPFMKRITHLPQYVLGAAFAWAVPMAFAAQTNSLPPVAWVLFVTVVVWTAAFDTVYAMVDRKDDVQIGVRSTAVLFGRADRLAIGIMFLLTLAGLVATGLMLGLGTWYWLGLLAAAGSLVYQLWLIAARDPERCFRAFLNNNVFGALVFSGIVLHFSLR